MIEIRRVLLLLMEGMAPASPSFDYLEHPHQKQPLDEEDAEDGVSDCGDDGFSLQKGLLFSDCLKDLQSLRSQLYSAAEYFEVFYRQNAQKPMVISSLKDYAVEALVSTVDHLSFVAHKVTDFMTEKSAEVAEAEFRVFSAEQRLRVCKGLIDREGMSQQSQVKEAPKYHKHYILQGNSMLRSSMAPVTEPPQRRHLDMRCGTHKQQTGRQPEMRKLLSVSPSVADAKRSHSLSPSKKAKHLVSSLQFARATLREKRAGSPAAGSSPLARAASLSTPVKSRVMLHSEKNDGEKGRRMSMGKRFLKSLLGMQWRQEDENIHCFLDGY